MHAIVGAEARPRTLGSVAFILENSAVEPLALQVAHPPSCDGASEIGEAARATTIRVVEAPRRPFIGAKFDVNK